MSNLHYMQLAKWSFLTWVVSWVFFAFLPNKGEVSSVPETVVYLALALWIVSYWVLHISFAKAKGCLASTGVGFAFLPILGLVILAMKKDNSITPPASR